MTQYIIAFSLYTLAMIGIFFIAFVVYKKTMNFNSSKLDNGMKIEDALRLSQRKTLFIINVQGERFLIASDVENTTFLAKLNSKETSKPQSLMPQINLEKQNLGPMQILPETKPEAVSNEADSKRQVEKYIKELEALNIANDITEKSEEEYSNAVNIKKTNSNVIKNILKELENSKRTNI